MHIGFIGLGRMGNNMVKRLVSKGHEVVGFDVNPEATAAITEDGFTGVAAIAEVVEKLSAPRVVFVMVQRQHVQGVLDELQPLLEPGDIIVDSGNTFYQETLKRVAAAEALGIEFVDVGSSGGTAHADIGFTLMAGGKPEVVKVVEPVLLDLAIESGYGHVGKSGAGHFVKMVHNGIEYGMMQAIGEGMQAIRDAREQFGTDLAEVLRVYSHGSIIESSLIGWTESGWAKDPELHSIEGTVPTGDTEAEMIELTKLARMPALETALQERQASREEPNDAMKFVAVMRQEFGDHAVKKKSS